MLLNTFKDIREKLSSIEEVKQIQWFNAQYDGIIHTSPVIFVEFPQKLPFDQFTKLSDRVLLTIRIHIVSAVVPGADNSIPDELIAQHEAIAQAAHQRLNGVFLNFRDVMTEPLKFGSYEHYHKYKGWMITFLEFSTKVLVRF